MLSVLTPRATALSQTQLDSVTIIERVGSVFSLLGCLFIIGTFCFSNAFHRPINRLVFFASFGNMMCNVATIMARDYLPWPSSVGCQLQAFLIQMFMPADAFWTLAMAINVYLTFYHRFDSERLRKMEFTYLLLCYGVPFVPAFVYIFVSNSRGTRVYGNATAWCWVTTEWDIWRILTFYGPVWLIIIVTFSIYLRTGSDIYKKRKQLENFTSDPAPLSTLDWQGSVKTTEISVTSEVVNDPLQLAQPTASAARRGSAAAAATRVPDAAYSVTITSNEPNWQEAARELGLLSPGLPPPTAAGGGVPPTPRRRNQDLNNASWSYTKCAILFFTAILITWIPSSANRFYSLLHAGEVSVPLQFMSSLVLPLQGFWNALIYIVTSWKAVKGLFAGSLIQRSVVRETTENPQQERNEPKRATRHYSSDSVAELAMSRSTSQSD